MTKPNEIHKHFCRVTGRKIESQVTAETYPTFFAWARRWRAAYLKEHNVKMIDDGPGFLSWLKTKT